MFRDNILATLAYYDVLDWPLTAGEVLRYLVKLERFGARGHGKPGPDDIKGGLEELKKQGIVSEYKGYYYILGRKYLIPLRLKKQKIAENKWRKAVYAVKCLKYIPFLRAIFASGSLALRSTSELSDLDIFVAVKSGHIWTVRFLTALVLQMLGMRRTNRHIIAPDKVCANHFITDESLEVPFHSMYTAQLYANLALLYGSRELFLRFVKENKWLLSYLYIWDCESGTKHVVSEKEPLPAGALRSILRHTIAAFIEKKLRAYQLNRIHGQTAGLSGGRVTYSDEQLEFHPWSPEAKIIPEYNRNLLKLGLKDFAIEKDSGLS